MIDAHVHVWDLSSGVYAWPDESVPAIHRSLSVEDVAPELERFGIDGVVLVQAADAAEDTRNMFRVASMNPLVRGVVAWADLAAPPEDFAADLEQLRGTPAFSGLRNLMHVKGVEHWILGPVQRDNVAQLAAAGIPLDVVTSAFDELGDVVTLIGDAPALSVVVDHLGKPPIGGSDAARREWRAAMADIAAHPSAVAKISGLSSAVGALDSWTADQVTPFIEDAVELFGPRRLMYGGDWPVAVLAGGYERQWRAVSDALAGLSPRDHAAVFSETAERVYGL